MLLLLPPAKTFDCDTPAGQVPPIRNAHPHPQERFYAPHT